MALNSPWIYFTDAVLKAPTLGCMLICFSASLVGVISCLKKQSLVGEALSHASFPGVMFGVIATSYFSGNSEINGLLSTLTLLGGFLFALFGLFCMHFLTIKTRIRVDSSLCFVLSSFFGVGVTLASRLQITHTSLYKEALTFLYGQAATMVDADLVIYASLSLLVLLMLFLFYKEIQLMIFDANYASTIGLKTSLINFLIFVLLTLSIVIGIRSVGVVLMSAMLTTPAVTARQLTQRLSHMFFLAGIFGLLSGFFGVYFSVEWTEFLRGVYVDAKISIPTGPMIVLVAAFFCSLSLLFAPQKGFLIRYYRRLFFRYRCLQEHILKAMWRRGIERIYSIKEIACFESINRLYLLFVIKRLKRQGWIEEVSKSHFCLTKDGTHRAAHIVRLHRLWELYLADYLEIGVERVHRSAEEMEHILTPELERQLTMLLQDPKFDPHDQPIPPLNKK